MVKLERIENRQLLLAAKDSALLNMIEHNKNDTMTLQCSSHDQKCEQQIKTRAESRLQQKRMSDQHSQSIDRIFLLQLPSNVRKDRSWENLVLSTDD
jgi:hypothetical protein